MEDFLVNDLFDSQAKGNALSTLRAASNPCFALLMLIGATKIVGG